jgi:hypothetical protein
MELYFLSKFASAPEELKYRRINLRRICKLLMMHIYIYIHVLFPKGKIAS